MRYNLFTQANGIFEDGDMPLSLYSTDTELGIKEYTAGLDLQSRPIEYKDLQSAGQQCTEPE